MQKYQIVAALLVSEMALAPAQDSVAAQRYQAISQEVLFHPHAPNAATFRFPPATRMEQATAELHGLAQAAIEAAIAKPGVTSASIKKGLSDLQGAHSLESAYPGMNVPFADLTSVNGFAALAVAFATLRGGAAIPEVHAYIQFYSRASGIWKLQEELGEEFRDRMFSVAPIKSAAPNEVWYLVWGKVIGDSGNRWRLRLYGFDGFDVRTIWQRDDVYATALSASPEVVNLEYEEFPAEGIPAPPRHVMETLLPGQTGLETFKREYHP